MTLDEAIEHCKELEDCSKCGLEHKQLREWLEEYKVLKERATPKKPKYIRNRIGDYEYICSNCGERFPYTRNCIDQHKYEYCPYCGKKTDWSDEE